MVCRVRDKDGEPLIRLACFDPAVINDDGTIRLYYGTSPPWLDNIRPQWLRLRTMSHVFNRTVKELKKTHGEITGAYHVVLADDMLTAVSEPVRIDDTISGMEYQDHRFFEGSSIRKIEDRYYYIYSSINNHELCYAVSKYPDKGFVYGGTIISNGDVGYKGRKSEDRLNHTGTNHGSIEKIGDQWYVFYHRHTQGSSYARQGCAEPIACDEQGRISQVEITSCGLNSGPLRAQGTYPAAICCNLFETKNLKKSSAPVCVDEEREDQESVSFISNMKNGSVAGYKYFAFEGKCRLTLRARVSLKDCSGFETLSPYKCKAEGKILVSTEADGKPVASMAFRSAAGDWEEYSCELNLSGRQELFFRYQGTGAVDIREIAFDR